MEVKSTDQSVLLLETSVLCLVPGKCVFQEGCIKGPVLKLMLTYIVFVCAFLKTQTIFILMTNHVVTIY